MKKSVVFLINGLGIEKANSYSIAIDECMPNLSRTRETSYFTTAFIESVEKRSAYEQFFLGDTSVKDLNYIEENILGERLQVNPTFQALNTKMSSSTCKLHVFLELTNEKLVNEINDLVTALNLDPKREVYLHLLLTQQTTSEYQKIIKMINYIQYNLNTCIKVGFIFGKEAYSDEMTKEENDELRKLFFYCSAERWTETDKKLNSLSQENIRPCLVHGFCATNSCTIQKGDIILFFNTRRTSYDKFLKVIFNNVEWAYKTQEHNLSFYSFIQLDTEFQIPCFSNSIVYDKAFSNLLAKAGKKALIITAQENMKLINFLANGLSYVNNPSIQFMLNDINYFSNSLNVQNIVDNTDYDIIIFDYHMDVSKTVNELKEQLSRLDVIIGHLTTICENKHSLFITSLYGLRKELPLAPYNAEMVTINYESMIPIFFYDYSYPRSKYGLYPGSTNDILLSAIKCVWDTNEIDSLVREKGLLRNFFRAFKSE